MLVYTYVCLFVCIVCVFFFPLTLLINYFALPLLNWMIFLRSDVVPCKVVLGHMKLGVRFGIRLLFKRLPLCIWLVQKLV